MHSFESKLYKSLKPQNLNQFQPVLCVSGGKDSVAMLRALVSIKKALQFDDFFVVYVHHGNSENKIQNEFRDKAEAFVKDLCVKHQLQFLPVEKPSQVLRSEEGFRDFRRQCYRELLQAHPNFIFYLAQHQQDQLETRLIRLIRGCGPEGLGGIKFVEHPYVRPLLSFAPSEIKQYLQDLGQDWLEDPSNESESYFRNWMRKAWLAQLEEYQPGAIRRLSESLDQIALNLNPIELDIITEKGLDRLKFRSLSQPQQKQVLAKYCLKKGIKNYTQGQFNELLKHLDRDEKMFTLDIMKSNWVVDAKHITVLFK